MTNFDTETIERKIGYSFENKSLLKLAFTHSSYANENKTASNEKLEFLGDSVLNFCVAEYLFRKGGGDEGTLSVMRSKIVSEPPLARCVDALDIIGHLICGVGEERNNPHKSDAVKADLFEAVLGAAYLDSGDISLCERLILTHLAVAVNDALEGKTPLKYTFRIIEKKPRAARAEKTEAAPASQPTGNGVNGLKGGKGRNEPGKGNNEPGKNRKQEKQELKEKKQEEKQQKREKKPGGADGKNDAGNRPQNNGPQADGQMNDGQKKKGLAQGLKKAKEKKGAKDSGAKDNNAAGRPKGSESRPVDYKSALQNHFQNEKMPKPEYIVTGQTGSAHEPIFNVEVKVEGRFLGSGAGGRKKDAEQAAAMDAYNHLPVKAAPVKNEEN